MAVDELKVDGSRLWQSLMDLAEIGATPRGGICRLALTDEDRDARALVVRWAEEAGCVVSVDPVGNIFARRPGRNSDRPVVMTGSHIDSQPTGGKFDGNYGVLAGLEAIRTLNDAGLETEASIDVVIWTNEEGSRFLPVMLGSAAFVGILSLDEALASSDAEGRTVREELERIGYAGTSPPHGPIDSYFEAHIEQGPILESDGTRVGAVVGALGQRWFDCIVTGFEAHAGPTPMSSRRDALQAATDIIGEIVAIAERFGPNGRGTVGYVDVFPNSRNVIPGRVSFSVDLRNSEEALLDAMVSELEAHIEGVRRNRGVAVALDAACSFPALAFDEKLVDLVRIAAEIQGVSCQDIVSGAGHDAIHLASIAPSAMIFIPCKDGVSHNEIEDAAREDVEAGANILLHCLVERAQIARR